MAGKSGKESNLRGRPAGVPNKATGSVRQTIAVMAEKLAPELIGWIREVAEEDKAKAVDLYLRAIEYHIPKLNRTTIEGDADKPIKHTVEWVK